MGGFNTDGMDLLKRAMKYVIEGVVVMFVAVAVPKKQLMMEEVLVLGVIAAATFSILDTFVPTMASSARSGAGFGIGANLVGFPAAM